MKPKEIYEYFIQILYDEELDPSDMDGYLWSDFTGEYSFENFSDMSGIEWVRSGASKMVIKLWECDEYVIKIPLHGDGVWDISEGDFTEKSEYRHALGEQDDYCLAEQEVYDKVLNLIPKSADILTRTMYVGSYGTIPIYVSEYADDIEGSDVNSSDAAQHEARIITPYISKTLLGMFIDEYGVNPVRDLIDMLKSMDLCEDINQRNCGIGRDGRVKMIDYSDFKY